ncbi:MAG: Amuc_1102 family pilus-like protein [Verrucomicrobiota bacterium]
MKKLTYFALSLAAFSASAFAAGDFEIKAVSVAFVPTPQYSVAPAQKLVPPQKWMQVEVAFDAVPEFTDELTFNYYILFAERLFVGHVSHVSIQKGRDLHSVAFISPKAIAQIMKGKTVSNSDLKNVSVTITKPGVSAPLSMKSAKASIGEWWAQMKAEEGFVVNKSETPFAPLAWDYYEALKPATSR